MSDETETVARLEGRIEGYQRVLDGQGSRLDAIHSNIWSQEPKSPGLALRLDRVERLLSTMLKIGYAVGGVGLLWKILNLIGHAISEGTAL